MKTAGALPDWGLETTRDRRPGYYVQRAAAVALAIAVAAAFTVVLGRVLGPAMVFWFDVVLALGLYTWISKQGRLALRTAGARRLARDEHERLWNVAGGLATDLKMRPPALYVIERGGPNALVCLSRGRALAVTRSLLETYTRTELEAVVAHCLVRFATSDVDRATLGIALGPLGSRTVPTVGFEDDVRAASVTRYPPGLAAAVEKAAPAPGRFAPLWFVGDGPAHRAAPDRAAALRDL